MKVKLTIGSIVAILIMSTMFLGPHESLTWRSYLMHCMMPAVVVAVFWINYLWLMPMLQESGGRYKVYLYNLLIIIVGCTFLTFWHEKEFQNRHVTWHKEQIVERHPPFRPERFDEDRHDHKDFGNAGDREEGKMRHHEMERRNRHGLINNINVLASLRDSVNFLFAIFVAYAIRSRQHIVSLKQKRQEAETAQRDAELRSLRNQISPHFLLNTLNNIYALTNIDTERARDAIMQLSKMLRHMLYDNQSEMVTLQSEVEFIRAYVDLMRLRLAQNVKVETLFKINTDKNTIVAPLLFISLVENAFKHGVSATENCIIKIQLVENEDGSIICDITNSNNPKTSRDCSGHGVGLQLVQKRLDIMYPDRYSWIKGVGADGMYHSVIHLKEIPKT